MKLLFDQNLSHRLCGEVAALFPGSAHVRPLGLAEADDRSIWNFARDNGFTTVTLDADFADLAMLYGPPPKVVWLRAGNRPSAAVAALLRMRAGAISQFTEDATAACLELY